MRFIGHTTSHSAHIIQSVEFQPQISPALEFMAGLEPMGRGGGSKLYVQENPFILNPYSSYRIVMDGDLTPLKGAESHCGCNSGSIQHNTWVRGGVVVH